MAGPVCSILSKVVRLCCSFCGSNLFSPFSFPSARMLSMLKWKVSPYQICRMLPPTSSYRTFPFQGPNHLLSSRRHRPMGKQKKKLGRRSKTRSTLITGEELGVETEIILTNRNQEFCASELCFLLNKALCNVSLLLQIFCLNCFQ